MNPADNAYPFELISRRLKALADPSRLAILHTLCGGENNVTELVGKTGFTQANVSKHLRVLREEGLVTFRKYRRKVYYALADTVTEDVCDLVCRSLEERASIDGERLKLFRSNRHE
jgi:DNA-binding transcriptional ArsR family regulator